MCREHDVEIRSAEAERADGSTWLAIAGGPRRGLPAQPERTFRTKRGVWHCDLLGGRQNPMMQRFGDFDDAGDASCTFGVADLALNRAELRLPRHRAASVKHVGQCLQLGAVADNCPRSMGLHEAHIRG
jgi:hypothetical protein